MKIALCFFGLPRNVKDTFHLFQKYLIEPNKIEDIFIHTYHKEYGDNVGNSFTESIYVKEDYETLFKYNPKKIEIESLYNMEKDLYYINLNEKYFQDRNECPHGTFAFQSQIYSRYKTNILKRSYNKYDIVILTRFDVELLKPIIVKYLRNDILNISTFFSNKQDGWMGDLLTIGSDRLINQYCNLWIQLKRYMYNMDSYRLKIHSEKLNHFHSKIQEFDYTPNLIFNDEFKLYGRDIKFP